MESLKDGDQVVLLVVAESHGSSPGRAGFKMLVTADELVGSIGGGAMEVALVDRARRHLKLRTDEKKVELVELDHRKKAKNPSGMICSGRQTIMLVELNSEDLPAIEEITTALSELRTIGLRIDRRRLETTKNQIKSRLFRKTENVDFVYEETLGVRDRLFIVGGGHCALALSEMAKRLGFIVSLFDDRSDLNTIAKNEFVDEITILDSYETIGDFIESDADAFVVVMTLGYKFDDIVIRALFDHDFRYFGVLGSRAKMAELIKSLENDGFDRNRLAKLRTPVGLPINSRTPEEIAVSIAAEMIGVRNGV